MIDVMNLCNLRNYVPTNFFHIEGNFYELQKGTAKGTHLLPIHAKLLISKFETKTKEKRQYFSKIWLKYADEVFATFDTKKSNIHVFIS